MTTDTGFEMDEMREIIDDFLVEADELIGSLDNNLVKLETMPEDLDLLNEIFRAAHTIKGTSSFLGFEQVTELTHKMEDILNKLRKNELKVSQEIMDILLQSIDLLKVLLDYVREGSSEQLDLTQILSELTAACTDGPVEAESKTVETDLNFEAGKAAADDLIDLTHELAASELPGEKEPGGMVKAAGTTKPGRKPTSDSTIRVDVNRLDTLMNMMGELVLSRNSLVQTVGKMTSEHEGDAELEKINQATASVNFITTELQMAVMKMRMQPVGKVFGKFPRLVRDLSRDSGKKIELIMSGESTELDRSVIEEIGDPLVHIIRNACDHGIEDPQTRLEKGKSESGKVYLSANQEGSNIIIKIEDDGKGLDIEAIREKAVERGLVSQSEIEKMPDREVYRYIFGAGFSTAKKITDVSGRGVGMDVVRTNIEKLNGIIDLDSKLGAGSTITIKLPLTLAIIQGLLVQSDEDMFILPLSSVHETVKTNDANIYYVNQRPVLRLRDEIIPMINLGRILNQSSNGFILTEKPYVVVVGLAEKKLGIIIDRFLGQEEVVIKSLGSYLGTTEGVAGATILGDGRIRLIVDLIGLFNIASKI